MLENTLRRIGARWGRVTAVMVSLVGLLGVGLGFAPIATSDSPLDPPANGPASSPPRETLIRGVTVHVRPGEVIEDAVVLVEDGRIGMVMPAETFARQRSARGIHAVVREYEGAHLYAGFVDAWVPVDAGEIDDTAPGAHWHDRITPQRSALEAGLPAGKAEKLRELGIVAAAITPNDHILRGTMALVSTAEAPSDRSEGTPAVYIPRIGHALAIETDGWGGRGDGPTSHMGAMALLRQSVIDARWTRDRGEANGEVASCLAKFDPDADFLLLNTANELEVLLGTGLRDEFNLPHMAIVGSGNELRRLDAVALTHAPIVLPLRYPRTPDVFSPGAADDVSLERLQMWERAPGNAAALIAKGVPVSITTAKLPKGQQFWTNMHKAIDAGLSADDALAALTTKPAALLGAERTHGAVESGKVASFVIASGPLFVGEDEADQDEPEILDVWVDGRRHEINEPKNDRFDGAWKLVVGPLDAPIFEMRFDVDGTKISLIEGEGDDANHGKARKVRIEGDRIAFVIDDTDDGSGSYLTDGVLTGTGDDQRIIGTSVSPDGSAFAWTGVRIDGDADDADDESSDDTDEDETDDTPAAEHAAEPYGPYAMTDEPAQDTVVITNATLWTGYEVSPIEHGTIVLTGGKIAAVGGAGVHIPSGARVIDGGADGLDLHVTPGLIDAHSHTSLFRLGVNEASEAVTSECRIADSIDPMAINWYRQLAGGITTANLLHGSANPIGGQSQTVKVRWGETDPDAMLFEGATPGIKFALGENVKQANWGDDYTSRYPQTRLGVETLMRDRFHAAQRYAKRMDEPGVRRDLELEALAQVLAGDRLVHCHSYRQDEIAMLCDIAEDFDFTIGTFQHGLEVYKVAEKVKEHAIGASLFSDWWAYKVEVQDAIPYAGPIQHEVGLLTSYNSDSDELARRMNLEAAKALKYARAIGIEMSEQDALNFVTRNPAIQLGIDDRVGTLETGKDADVVVWTHHPLSSFAKPAYVFIDGRERFSLEHDAELREQIRAERERLIQKILAEGKPSKKDDVFDEEPDSADAPADVAGEGEDLDPDPENDPERRGLARYYRAMDAAGRDADTMMPLDCGCNVINHHLYRRWLDD